MFTSTPYSISTDTEYLTYFSLHQTALSHRRILRIQPLESRFKPILHGLHFVFIGTSNRTIGPNVVIQRTPLVIILDRRALQIVGIVIYILVYLIPFVIEMSETVLP